MHIVAATFDQKGGEHPNNGNAASGDGTIAFNLRNTHAIANMKLQWHAMATT
jgi:hypothetical protein